MRNKENKETNKKQKWRAERTRKRKQPQPVGKRIS